MAMDTFTSSITVGRITSNSILVNGTLSISNSGIISSGATLSLKGQSVRLINGLNQIIISFNSTGIYFGMVVNMNSNSISSLTDLTASGNVTKRNNHH